MDPTLRPRAPSPPRSRLLLPFALLALAALTPGCAEGLANAPGIQRKWTQQDFEHDVISNGPESCPREGQDPLARPGHLRWQCPETPDAPRANHPASP
jgi:hypothetical protein